MLAKLHQVCFSDGLHARPAAAVLKAAKEKGCRIFVKIGAGWQEAGIVNLMTQAVAGGGRLEIAVDGGAEEACQKAIEKILSFDA